MSDIQTWWLVRHAPPINPDDLCYGRNDIEADYSDDSRFTALATGIPDDAVWIASPLQRAFKTGCKVMSLKALDPVIVPVSDKDLMEQSFGDWEVQSKSSLQGHPLFIAYHGDPASVRPPNGESMTDMFNRVSVCIDRLRASHDATHNIAVFCHGGTVRSGIVKATGMAIAETLKIPVRPLDGIKLFYDRREKAWQPRFERF